MRRSKATIHYFYALRLNFVMLKSLRAQLSKSLDGCISQPVVTSTLLNHLYKTWCQLIVRPKSRLPLDLMHIVINTAICRRTQARVSTSPCYYMLPRGGTAAFDVELPDWPQITVHYRGSRFGFNTARFNPNKGEL